MHCVSCVVCSENCPDRVRRRLLRLLRLSRSDELTPLLYRVLCHQLKTSHHVRSYELHQRRVERLASVFAVEFSCCILIEFGHFHFGNSKSVLANDVNDFASACVRIRLNHSKCSLSFALEPLSCEQVSIFNELQLSRENRDNRANEEFVN